MPVDKFRFVSPGIFLEEVDQSQIPAIPENVGPVIIGRAEKGPGMIPTTVRSFSEFVEVRSTQVLLMILDMLAGKLLLPRM